eukprot:scaffold4215_cov551-Prasinococcus_capsulatus_cf.AAC.3
MIVASLRLQHVLYRPRARATQGAAPRCGCVSTRARARRARCRPACARPPRSPCSESSPRRCARPR